MSHKRRQRQLLQNVIGLSFTNGTAIAGLGTSGAAATGITLRPEYSLLMTQAFSFTSLVAAVTDTGGASGGFASVPLFTFPAKRIQILGGYFTSGILAAAGISAGATITAGIGTAAEATDSTLSGAQQDIINSTSQLLTASAGTVTLAQGIQFSLSNFSSGTQQLFLNFGIPDASISSNSSFTLSNGTGRIYYLELGL